MSQSRDSIPISPLGQAFPRICVSSSQGELISRLEIRPSIVLHSTSIIFLSREETPNDVINQIYCSLCHDLLPQVTTVAGSII
jgi:hypothetical protein